MRKVLICIFYLFAALYSQAGNNPEISGWKAGMAEIIITPKQPIWMAGYAARTKPAEGKLHDLRAKSLFLKDTTGNEVLLVTTDLLGFPKAVSDRIRDRLQEQMGLSRSQIILNSSHTHSGPVLTGALTDIYPPETDWAQIENYTNWLIEQIVTVSEKASKALKPVMIYAGTGIVRFQVNRRNNSAAKIMELTELKGPNDFAVPVLKITDTKGKIKSIVMGYACHPTVLEGYQWSGDYPGFAQLDLEKKYKGATVLFFQGGGADQNPLPRHSVPLARQFGQELAAAVERVLEEDMRKLSPVLRTTYNEINLEMNEAPSRAKLISLKDELKNYQKTWAESMLKKLDAGESLQTSYPYPVQIWQIGDQMIISLGGELLINYSIRLKKILGKDLFVMGYSNDVMAYIPGEKVLSEGWYEGETSQMVYGLPATWKAGIEDKIIDEVIRQAQQIADSNKK